jgi:glycosyl transferase, family 25
MIADAVRTRIFVISMRNATVRRQTFAADDELGTVDWSFYDAQETLHPDLHYDENHAIITKGRPLTVGEIGCYSSHYALWQKLIGDEDADQYVVLEDDVIVDWRYLEAFTAQNHQVAGRDYIRLYYKKPVPLRILQKGFMGRATWLVELSGYCFGTQAYLLTKNGAKRFAEQCRIVNRPIDDQMDRSWIHNIPNLAVFPFPVIERCVDSGIGASRFDRYQIPSHLRLRRFFARNVERVRYWLFGRLHLPFRQ